MTSKLEQLGAHIRDNHDDLTPLIAEVTADRMHLNDNRGVDCYITIQGDKYEMVFEADKSRDNYHEVFVGTMQEVVEQLQETCWDVKDWW